MLTSVDISPTQYIDSFDIKSTLLFLYIVLIISVHGPPSEFQKHVMLLFGV